MVKACGALARIFPELDRLWGVPQRADYHPEVDTGVHVMMVLDMAARLKASLPVRWACLCHDLGKGTTPADVLPRHIGHEMRSVKLLLPVCERFRVPVACKELAEVVAREHANIHRCESLRAAALLRLVERCDGLRKPERFDEILLSCECDARGRLGHTERPYPQGLRLGLALDLVMAVDTASVSAQALAEGKTDPKYAGQKPNYAQTDEARWMNRRVALTVTDAQGRTVGAGGAGDAIRAIEPAKPAAAAAPAPMADCCNEVLKRLDKLDDIAKMLKDLSDQNADLRRQVADLRGAQDQLRAAQQATDNRVGNLPKPPSATDVAAEVEKNAAKNRDPRFQLLGVNLGGTDNGDITFTGRGRFFAPIGSQIAIQAGGEYMYHTGQKEGQFDLGIVDRFAKNFQAGLFTSFKHVNLSGNTSGGTLGQAAVAFDYIFKQGKVGVFGTKGFLDNAVINRQNAVVNGLFLRNIILERYLHIVDQAGVSGTINLMGNNYLEGNFGYLKSSGYGDRFGGTLRLVMPINSKVAFTVEGGVNETLLGRGNNSRAVVGIQFGKESPTQQHLAGGLGVGVAEGGDVGGALAGGFTEGRLLRHGLRGRVGGPSLARSAGSGIRQRRAGGAA